MNKTLYAVLLIIASLIVEAQTTTGCNAGNETNIFALNANFSPNYILGVRIPASFSGTLTGLSLYGVAGTGSRVQMALYADNAGNPSNLLATSSIGNVVNGPMTLSVSPIAITAGSNYWIMAVYDIAGANSKFLNTSPKTVRYRALSFGSAMPSNASTFSSYTGQDFNYWMNITCSTGITCNVSPLSYCAGESVTVTYTKTGTFTAGNVFTAQLSNASGIFTSPVNIGTVTSVNSGTISATIPANTPAGTGYRIRVISSTPSITGTDNGSNITVTAPSAWYLDADNDNYYTGSGVTQCTSPGAGWTSTLPIGGAGDCDDNNINIWLSATLYIDADNDDYDNGTATVCYGATIPAGYKASTLGSDCNDNNNLLTTSCGPKTWNGGSTMWNSAGNWTPSGIPTATDDVIIPDLANDPTMSFIPGNVRDLTIADGVTIGVNSGIALYINGNITAGSGSGSTIAGAGGVVELKGSDAQQINGKLTVRTLRINNSSMGGVDVLGTLDITNGLIMIDGDVNANSGTVTLKSGPTTAAYLDNFTSPTAGTYSGDLTVERYIANTADGYRNISSPVNTTVADLADDMSISGADGVNCWYSYSPYPNVQVYEEAANNGLSTPAGNYYTGWISKTGPGNAMSAMKGFALRTYAGAPFTIDLTGTPYTGSKSADLTNTPSATAAQDGWNFIGNPFPSPISWNNTEANNPGATTGSYYVFNTTGEYTGNWGSWNGSTGTNGATDNIGIMQGFFVRTTNPYNYVEANNASRVASATIPFFKSYSAQPNEIRLSLHDATNSDEIVAYTDGAATWSEDMGHDAVKIPAGSTVYMSYKQLGKEYAINVIDEITETTELPLVLWAQDTGTYTFEATELNVDGYTVYLKDAELNTLTDLTTTSSVTMQLNGQQTYEGRYSIVFEEVEIPSGIANINEGKTKIYSHRNIAVVERNNDQPATITITNTLGQTIKEVTTDSKRTEITLDNANAWYAIVKVKEANATQTGKVLIQ